LWFSGLGFGLVWAKEELLRLALKSPLAQAQYRRRFVLVGAREELEVINRDAIRTPSEMEIIARLNLDEAPVAILVKMMHEFAINGVIISARRAHFEEVEAVIRACELEGVEIWLMADLFQTQISRTSLDEWHGKPMLIFRSAPETSWQREVKKLMDYLLSSLTLALLALPLVLIALLVKLSAPGPIFFRQQRAGLNGRPFTMFKFRTMISHAEQLQCELAALSDVDARTLNAAKARITPIGRFLRKFRLDEVPQLMNVLRGEMSLVGPRPLTVHEVARFDDVSHRRRLSVKPGLTCLWQIRRRDRLNGFKDWVRLDLEYIDHWSLRLDVAILLRTVPLMILGAGTK
jgi:exopolysaccharide biosynthesis polyprenyl glycosylphosphotransferase